ncbi:MAG: hypothetical protein V1822_00690 [Candidatus Micrarchaeota archaeon]
MSYISKDEKNPIRLYALLTIALVLGAIVLAGCVQSGAPEANNQGGSIAQGSGSLGANVQQGTNMSAGAGDQIMAENKTSAQKVQEQIAAMVPDGTYMKNVSYNYHSGTETMEVSLTVQNDVVTGASITPMGTPAPFSLRMMEAVNGSLPNLVIGKRIEDISIPRNVAGSSLTSAAFKNYVQDVIDQYKQ